MRKATTARSLSQYDAQPLLLEYVAAASRLHRALDPTGGPVGWGSFFEAVVNLLECSGASFDGLVEGGALETIQSGVHSPSAEALVPAAPAPPPPPPPPPAPLPTDATERRSKLLRMAQVVPVDASRPGMVRGDPWLWAPLNPHAPMDGAFLPGREEWDEGGVGDYVRQLMDPALAKHDLWNAVHAGGRDLEGRPRADAEAAGVHDDMTETARVDQMHLESVMIAAHEHRYGDYGERAGATPSDQELAALADGRAALAFQSGVFAAERFRRRLLHEATNLELRARREEALQQTLRSAVQEAQAEQSRQLVRQWEPTGPDEKRQARALLEGAADDSFMDNLKSARRAAIRAAAIDIRRSAALFAERSAAAVVLFAKVDMLQARLRELMGDTNIGAYRILDAQSFTEVAPLAKRRLAERDHIVRLLGPRRAKGGWPEMFELIKLALTNASGDAPLDALPALKPCADVLARVYWDAEEWADHDRRLHAQEIINLLQDGAWLDKELRKSSGAHGEPARSLGGLRERGVRIAGPTAL